MLIRDCTYKDITSVTENATLRRVIKTMILHRICALPVINHLGEYIGCISEQDILNASMPEYMKSIYNTSFMANLDHVTGHLEKILDETAITFTDDKYPSVSPLDSVSFAADLLYRTQRTILPVVSDKMLLGLISRIDILSATLKEQDK